MMNWWGQVGSRIYNARPWAEAVQVPTLVLSGAHDVTCSPEEAATIAGWIPDAQQVLFQESGHLPQVEEREAWLEAVRGWLLPAIVRGPT